MQTKPLGAREDVVSGLGPANRLRVGVVDLDVVPDRFLELARGAMRALADVLLRLRGEPAFDLNQSVV